MTNVKFLSTSNFNQWQLAKAEEVRRLIEATVNQPAFQNDLLAATFLDVRLERPDGTILGGLTNRQILDIIYQRGQATAAEVQAELPDPPSYSAVRALLRILEDKGHVRHDQDGPRYVYLPTVARDNAQRSALRHILQTFFDGSAEQAISALLDDQSSRFSTAELDRLARMIDTARKSGA